MEKDMNRYQRYHLSVKRRGKLGGKCVEQPFREFDEEVRVNTDEKRRMKYSWS